MEEKRSKIVNKLNEIFRDVFDDDDISVFDEMSAADIDEWDSLMHVSLVVATEKAFSVKLNAVEVAELENVGAMVDLLLEKAAL